ncbi:MAG: ThuA domain-containing protein [Chloroflexi bacterium]|nr:ThuA domain-containing protein [Chloroflexota bacterium]
MADIRILCMLGGVYHPFEEAERFFGDRLSNAGCDLRFSYDPEDLRVAQREDVDLVILYTCFSDYELTEDLAESLAAFVSEGGGLLALHGATSSFRTNRAYHALIGATFVEHGPRHNFVVMPMQWRHPVTQGIEAFTVNDELYLQEFEVDKDIDIQMAAVYFNRVQPVVWTREHGAGRLCYIALGHDEAVWAQPEVWHLILNSIAWCGQR